MTTVYDVPPKELIEDVASKFESDPIIQLPEENVYSRTGVHTENPPNIKNWWQIRCAAIMRKIYVNNGIGIEHLRAEFGGRQNKGSKPHKAKKGSGTIIRRAVQQLEKAGYIQKIKGKGRVLTPKGQSFMDNASKDVLKKIESYYPELNKY